MTGLSAQQPLHMNYYLPEGTSYRPTVETPQDFMGFLPGEWHYTHDQVVYYCKALAASSDRVIYAEYGRTYENRPLFHLIISHPDNIRRIEEIQQAHVQLSDPKKDLDVSNMPTVVNLGYTVHGNEQSGVGAAVIMAYYLAAGESRQLDSILREVVILVDPCLNPDGMNRFSSWVNMHKSKNLVSNPASREFNEPWPGSRTNHYWFDLNRDWLPVVNPESRGRIKALQKWQPNIVSDYHEMGTNSTYFFQPGVPSRNNPLTPAKTFELTKEVGKYHARYLDKIGSLYYSEEDFDDFYFGKGSTYPDINGAIGILFEQASSRGHLQDSKFGPLSYPFTIRNQVYASLSSIEAGWKMRIPLLQWRKEFYQSAIKEANAHPVKAFIFHGGKDDTKSLQFIDILEHHQIEVYTSKKVWNDGKKSYPVGSYIVPLDQRQYRLIRGIFDTTTSFQDSLFYDVSSWTLPLGMHLQYSPINNKAQLNDLLGSPFSIQELSRRPEMVPPANYGYLLEWWDYNAPIALHQLLSAGVKVMVNHEPFKIPTHRGEQQFERGTLIIPLQIQDLSPESVRQQLQTITNNFGLSVHGLSSGQSITGIDLGSPKVDLLKTPTIAILAGSGMSSYDCGEVWHMLDQKMQIQAILVDANQWGRLDLSKTTHIILPSGSPSLSDNQVAKLKEWVQGGGILIGLSRANSWLASKGLIALDKAANVPEDNAPNQGIYAQMSAERGAQLLSGAIFNMQVDLTNPLFYGYEQSDIAVFRRGTDFYKPTKNSYATPGKYAPQPLLSGYVPTKIMPHIGGHAAVMVFSQGSGRVISILDNPVFRGYWTGTHRLLMNAIFLGPTITFNGTQRAE
jgi:hypothetical protein